MLLTAWCTLLEHCTEFTCTCTRCAVAVLVFSTINKMSCQKYCNLSQAKICQILLNQVHGSLHLVLILPVCLWFLDTLSPGTRHVICLLHTYFHKQNQFCENKAKIVLLLCRAAIKISRKLYASLPSYVSPNPQNGRTFLRKDRYTLESHPNCDLQSF